MDVDHERKTLNKNLTHHTPLEIPFHLLDFITTERTIDFVHKNQCINHCRAADTVHKGSEYSNVYKAVCNGNENLVRRVDVV